MPYSQEWVPFRWRGWWHFGGGTLSDFCCHHIDLSDYGRHLLLPEDRFKDVPAPAQTLADSVGHHEEWIRAVKGKNLALPQFAPLGRTNSPFDYGGLLTEIGQLGNIAFRTGQRIVWDAERIRAKGVPEADRFIHHEYRKGWKLG